MFPSRKSIKFDIFSNGLSVRGERCRVSTVTWSLNDPDLELSPGCYVIDYLDY